MYIEDEKTELKEIFIDDIKREIVAFLNTTGGTIYVGVTDDGVVKPVLDNKIRDEMYLKVASWISDSFYPETNRLIKCSFNKDNVFEINVLEGDEKPYYLKDKGPKPSGLFKRVGSSTRKASDNEILLMIMDSKNYSYECDVSEEQDLTFEYLFEQFKKAGFSYTKRNLTSLRLINKDGLYTNLAYLLSDQSNVVLKFAKYDSELNFKIKKQFTGSLIKILDNVLEYSSIFNNVSAKFDKTTFKRIETLSFPGMSLREAILNAVAHANYFIRSNIKIEIFTDKCKITNPGGIYQATLKDILSGVQTYRNPALVNILDKLGYIENYGSGIPRIFSAYDNYDKKPIFNPSENFFIVELPDLNSNDPVNDPVNSNFYSDLNESEIKILKIIDEAPGLNTKQILLKMDDDKVTLDMIKNSLKRKLSKYCKFIGAPKNGGYYLI